MPVRRSDLNGYEPPIGFRFVVDIDNQRIGAFVDCKLPTLSWQTQEIKEGGLNSHTHQLIGPRKKAELTLKRGVAISSDLLEWYVQTLNQQVSRRRVTVMLLDISRRPIMTWFIEDAYPTKWTGPTLKTDDKAIAIETLTLACGRISVEMPEQS